MRVRPGLPQIQEMRVAEKLPVRLFKISLKKLKTHKLTSKRLTDFVLAPHDI